MRTTSFLAALFLAGTSIVAIGQNRPVDDRAAARAPTARPVAALAVPALEDLSKQPTPIPGVTDKLGVDEKKLSELLGDEFESQVAGISFRPPADCKQVRGSEPDKIVEYSNEDRHWLLKVTRARLGQAMPLQSVKIQDQERKGLLDITVAEVMKSQPTPTIMRQEIINVGENAVGLAFFHVDLGSDRFLRQQAIFQANEQLYYIFNLTTPSSKANPENDPEERLAARTFMAMLDTIQLLDRAWIKTDQVNRLFRTRALFTDWNDKEGKRIKDAMIPEQWLRIVRNGKDIGYSYQVEEFVEGRNVKNNPGRLRDGLLVSLRTRTIDGNNQIDLGMQMFTSLDRKHEDWSQIMNLVANRGLPAEDKRQNMEFGFSEIRVRRVLDKEAVRDPKFDPAQEDDRNLRDPKNPILKNVETYALGVDRASQGQNNNNKSEKYVPSPWYIPQAVGAMIPRLVPLNRPVTYLFQSYVSDQQAVIMRYVDVGFEKPVKLDGKLVRAIPISDRIRLEGVPIVHYMSPDGKYLGSINEELKLQILPTDKATLEKLWTTADLTKPEIERPAAPGVR